MADNETIADIIAEKRRDAQYIRNNLSTVPVRRLDQLAEIRSLADEADRLEAAHKREVRETEDLFRKSLKKQEDTLRDQYEALVGFSNIARLREALRLCMGAMCKYCREDAKARGLPMECVNGCEALLMAKAALAAPPRNCDRFATVDEARKAHEAICEEYVKCHNGCPLNNEEHYSAFDCFEAWLFAPATVTEGGAK